MNRQPPDWEEYRQKHEILPPPMSPMPPLPVAPLPPKPNYKLERLMTLCRYNFECQYCGGFATEADHFIPRSKGGSDWSSNLVAACGPCNRAAGDVYLLDFGQKWLYVWTRRNLG